MQNKVTEFNKTRGVHLEPMSVSSRLLDITSEMGELSKEYLKASNYGTSEFVLTEDFEMEYGDVLYSMLSLADEANIDANKALEKVINKYKARIEKNKNMGSGN